MFDSEWLIRFAYFAAGCGAGGLVAWFSRPAWEARWQAIQAAHARARVEAEETRIERMTHAIQDIYAAFAAANGPSVCALDSSGEEDFRSRVIHVVPGADMEWQPPMRISLMPEREHAPIAVSFGTAPAVPLSFDAQGIAKVCEMVTTYVKAIKKRG